MGDFVIYLCVTLSDRRIRVRWGFISKCGNFGGIQAYGTFYSLRHMFQQILRDALWFYNDGIGFSSTDSLHVFLGFPLLFSASIATPFSPRQSKPFGSSNKHASSYLPKSKRTFLSTLLYGSMFVNLLSSSTKCRLVVDLVPKGWSNVYLERRRAIVSKGPILRVLLRYAYFGTKE